MKKVLIVATALAAASSVHAADLGMRTYTKAPAMVEHIATWSGLYIGGNAGYGSGGRTDFSFLPSPVAFAVDNTSLDTKPKGAIWGAQIGYNWQMGSLVTGLEADIQGADIKGSASRSPIVFNEGTLPIPGSFLSSDQKLSWFGTVRGRLGATVVPDLLLYGTAGLAYGEIKGSANTFFTATNNYPAKGSETRVGWTAGAGAEWMFARHWSAKVEYLYVDLGSASAIGLSAVHPALSASSSWKTQENIVRAGVNYHF
jgi:outer membrane immunogenic protein